MRICIVLLALCSFCVSTSLAARERVLGESLVEKLFLHKVSVSGENLSARSILEAIGARAGVEFLVDAGVTENISLDVDNCSLYELFNFILDITDLQYIEAYNAVFIHRKGEAKALRSPGQFTLHLTPHFNIELKILGEAVRNVAGNGIDLEFDTESNSLIISGTLKRVLRARRAFTEMDRPIAEYCTGIRFYEADIAAVQKMISEWQGSPGLAGGSASSGVEDAGIETTAAGLCNIGIADREIPQKIAELQNNSHIRLTHDVVVLVAGGERMLFAPSFPDSDVLDEVAGDAWSVSPKLLDPVVGTTQLDIKFPVHVRMNCDVASSMQEGTGEARFLLKDGEIFYLLYAGATAESVGGEEKHWYTTLPLVGDLVSQETDMPEEADQGDRRGILLVLAADLQKEGSLCIDESSVGGIDDTNVFDKDLLEEGSLYRRPGTRLIIQIQPLDEV